MSREQRETLIAALTYDHRMLYYQSADFHAFINGLADGLIVMVQGAVEGAAMEEIRRAAAFRDAAQGTETPRLPSRLYEKAQEADAWPGEEHPEGSSLLAHIHSIAGRTYETGPPEVK